MGKKDKNKVKGAEKTAAKTEKKHGTKLKKELSKIGEEDIETLIAKFVEEDKRKTTIQEDLVPPPSKRSSFTFTAHPDKDQLILFGGEYYNGSKTLVNNDLFFYSIKQDRWTKITCPGSPPPRSGHQSVVVPQGGGQLWVFGGEYTSPSQSQFYHYKDLWVFHINEKKWEKINAVAGPSSRSGHRMVVVKKQILIFGGFHDNLRDYKYYNDVYAFNLEDYKWKKLDVTGNGPCPRSACQMMSLQDGRVLIFGGYSKEKIKKDVDKGVTHTDMFFLTQDKHDMTGMKWKWITIKQSGIRPSPRCGFSMAPLSGDKAVIFGGVYDEEKDDEDLEGTFFNDLYQLDLCKTLWHKVNLIGKKEVVCDKKKRRKEKEGDEEGETEEEEEDKVSEDMQNKLDKMNMKEEEIKERILSDDGVFTVTIGPSASTSSAMVTTDENGSSQNMFLPPPRINCGLVVKRGIVYLYGGMFEDGDKQLTLDDFYSLDLGKLDEWKTIIPLKPQDLEWFDSESDDDDDDDDDGDINDDEDEDMSDDEKKTAEKMDME